jgi:SWIM/SEC-C metal-binding protein
VYGGLIKKLLIGGSPRVALIGIEPDKPEDISEVQRLLNPPKPIQADPKVGRNDPCPCGSGKKFKKCCMNKQQ